MSFVDKFNMTVKVLTEQLSIAVPHSIISNNKGYIFNLLDKHPNLLIDAFVIYVLKDKDMIDKEDDNYFMNIHKKSLTLIFTITRIFIHIVNIDTYCKSNRNSKNIYK